MSERKTPEWTVKAAEEIVNRTITLDKDDVRRLTDIISHHFAETQEALELAREAFEKALAVEDSLCPCKLCCARSEKALAALDKVLPKK